MDARKFAIGGVIAGLLFAGWGTFGRDDHSSTPAPPGAVEAIGGGQPTVGLATTAESVDFWAARVAASPGGYLDRTQLAIAMSARARETADLVGYEAAEREFLDVLTSNADHLPAKLGLAGALHSQHRFVEARVLAGEVHHADQGSLGALALLGDASLELGDYTAAQRHYSKLAEQERSAPVVSRLSRLSYATGDPAGAVALAEEALTLSEQLDQRPSDRAFAWFQLGHVRFATGEIGGAIEALERAIEIAPGHPGATERLAFIFASIGRSDEAESLYRELLDSGPAADIHGSYSVLLQKRGNFVLADEQEQLALDLANATIDRFPAERRHLVGFFLTRDPSVAVGLAERDLADRKDFAAYDTLAWALHHDGNTSAAAALIAPMLESGVQDASVLYHAAAISNAVGDIDNARRYLDAALSINDRFHPTEALDAAALHESLR